LPKLAGFPAGMAENHDEYKDPIIGALVVLYGETRIGPKGLPVMGFLFVKNMKKLLKIILRIFLSLGVIIAGSFILGLKIDLFGHDVLSSSVIALLIVLVFLKTTGFWGWLKHRKKGKELKKKDTEKLAEEKTIERMSKMNLDPDKDWQEYYKIRAEEEEKIEKNL